MLCIDQLISVTSNLEMNLAKYIKFATNDSVNITVTVNLSKLKNIYFRQFTLGIYNNLKNLQYYWNINSEYWTRTVSIASGHHSNAGNYEVVLNNTYSSEFIANCSSYYNVLSNSPFSLTSIIRGKILLHLHYYGKLIDVAILPMPNV